MIRAVPIDHRIIFHYCEQPTLIGGNTYHNVCIPLVQRRRNNSWTYGDSYFDSSDWQTVGVFDLPCLAKEEIQWL